MKIAEFYKISREQFDKDLFDFLSLSDNSYDNVIIPKRATKGSAGYDFYSPASVTLNPNEHVRIPYYYCHCQ